MELARLNSNPDLFKLRSPGSVVVFLDRSFDLPGHDTCYPVELVRGKREVIPMSGFQENKSRVRFHQKFAGHGLDCR